MTTKLKGHRLEQLHKLLQAGAFARETAVAVALGYTGFRPVTLSAMIGEGLVENAYLPFQGDSRRRCSHYWLTERGRQIAEGNNSPIRVQLQRTKGWRMPANTVKVDRTTKWGNPFNLKHSVHCWTAVAHGFKGDPAGRHAASIAMFEGWIQKGSAVKVEGCGLYLGGHPLGVSPTIEAVSPPTKDEIRASLRGKNLACWCAPDKPCHADVLLNIANPNQEKTND